MKRLCVASVLCCLQLVGLAFANDEVDVRVIAWNDLIPKMDEPFDDPFERLSEDQLYDLRMIARIRFLIENGKIVEGGTDLAEEKKLVAKLTGQGIDVDWLFSQRERVAKERQRRAERVHRGVTGQLVRIPGYMLPLKTEESGVTEFLLVPWVGACIHTPPPPPNQMVHVRVPGGTNDRGRFAAIWLEGRIELKPAEYDLFLADGTRSVKVAYTMTTATISTYSSQESDVLARVEAPAFDSEHSWVQQWQIRAEILFTQAMTDIQNSRSSGPMLWGLLVSFFYGILHTLGPGHGKTVVAAYFVGERGSLWRGLRMGGQIALFHVLSAVIVVVITDFAVRQATGQSPSDYRAIRLASYGSIIAIGLWMIIRALKAARSHHHHHEGCGCAHLAEPSKGVSGLLSVAVGAVPCTGALLVLLFGLANDLLWPSIMLVIAISLGMALALSGIGVAAILGRRFLDRRLGQDDSRKQRTASVLRVGAATGVFLIGCLLFVVAW